MPLRTWDVVVHGRNHCVELDRNPETGKHLLRVDGRIALRPFSESIGEFPVTIGDRPYLLHLRDGSFELEDKGSRYTDAAAPAPAANLGAITICRGLESIAVITDDALLRISKLNEMAMGMIGANAAGGGILGQVLSAAAVQLTQKAINELGPKATLRGRIRSFADLESETVGRLEYLPDDLINLFSGEVDLECPVLIVPRRAIRSLEIGRTSLKVTTRPDVKPHKLELITNAQQAIDHLCAAGYPIPAEANARASESARILRQNLREAPPRPAEVKPAEPAPAPRQFSGLPEVSWTAPLVSAFGPNPEVLAQMEADAAQWSKLFPKTKQRTRSEDPLRNLGRERYEVVHMTGVFDGNTRFREPGVVLSLKDLIIRLVDGRVRMLWLASANDAAAAKSTLDWAAGLNFFVVFTTVRADDYPSLLGTALARMTGGEPLSRVLPELEAASPCRFVTRGRGETIFRP